MSAGQSFFLPFGIRNVRSIRHGFPNDLSAVQKLRGADAARSRCLLGIVRPSVRFPAVKIYSGRSRQTPTEVGSDQCRKAFRYSMVLPTAKTLAKSSRQFRVHSSHCLSALRKAKSSTLEISQRIINGRPRKTRPAGRGFLCSGMSGQIALPFCRDQTRTIAVVPRISAQPNRPQPPR